MLMFIICVALPWSAAAQQPEIATTVAFTEGPAVDREGNVYFTDIINQRIMKLGKDGVLSTYRENSNVANGLLIDPQGRLIACEGAEFERPGVKVKGKPRVTRTDLKTGKIEVLVDNYAGKPLQGPNDVTIDGKGRLYFTDLPGSTHPAKWCGFSRPLMCRAQTAFRSRQTTESCTSSKPIRRRVARG
jgi:gluconolactonase